MMGGTIMYYTMGEKAFKWQIYFPFVCKNVDKELRHSSIPDIRIEIKLMAWKTIRQKICNNVVEEDTKKVSVVSALHMISLLINWQNH